LQCDRHIVEFETPEKGEIEASDKRILPLYLEHDLPKFLMSYDRQEWSREIDRIKDHIKPEASPGVPCAITSNRNDKLMEIMGERLNDAVLDRVEKLRATDIEELRLTDRRKRMDDGLMDPVRVFVKNEPHKIEKIEQGRVRLIMSVSIVDKIIEMLLSRHLCKLEIQNWRDIPSKPGIGFSEGDNAAVYEDILGCGLPMSFADIQGWDWSVKAWMIEDEAESAIKLARQTSLVWRHLMRAKAILESETVFQFSDGVMVMPIYKGIVNSGKLRTSRGNSFMRVRLADLIGSRKTIAAGDDSVENTVEDAQAKYRRLGIVCKEYETVETEFEFCSRLYGPGYSYALNKEKMIMNLLHQEPRNSLEFRASMIGFADELSSRPDYDRILELIESVGYYEVEGPHYDARSEDEF